MEEAFNDDTRDELFVRALAHNALVYPEWGLDRHKEEMLRAGFPRDYVLQHSRVIAEAIHHRVKIESRIQGQPE